MNYLSLSLCLLMSWLSFSPQAGEISQVKQELLTEIKQANQRYQQQLSHIAEQRKKLTVQLSQLERQTQKLTEQSQQIIRNKDEQSLSLEVLQQRLNQWRQQLNYLHHLFDSLSPTQPIRSASELEQWLAGVNPNPHFIEQRVALPSGKLSHGQALTLGPLSWFLSADQQVAGLIKQEHQQWHLIYALSTEEREQFAKLYNEGRGLLAVDPSHYRSIKLAQHQESVLAHLKKGGIWILPILLFALLALIIALVKAVHLLKLPALQPLYGSAKKLGVYQQKLLALAQQHQGQQLDDLLLDELMRIKRTIERGLTVIAVTASVAPLLGLLGTVSGMIQTFKLMTLFGSGDANAVSGGISESLVTTEMGLIVAIPALVVHALMSRKCQHYMSGLESFAVQLSHKPEPQLNGVSNAA